MKKIIFTMVLSSIIIISSGFCASPKKIAVCPMEMNAAQDLSFLQKGLFTMLSSRLADPGKIEILEREIIDKALGDVQSSHLTKGALNESKARLIGENLDVDYVLFGSLTMFGQSVSLDISMVEVNKVNSLLTFSRQVKESGDVIFEMNNIAALINFQVFGRGASQVVPGQQGILESESIPARKADSKPMSNYRNLMSVNGEVIGISSGDVDGDKKNEVVIIYDHAIEILEYNLNKRLKSVKKIKEAHYMDIVGVDVADINHNGTAEIFISRVHPESGDVKSFVLEYSNEGYKKIADNLPWYLRVVKKDGIGADILYAQKCGEEGPYKGRDVFKVNWQNSTYVPGEKVTVPEGFSVLSMATGKSDAMGKAISVFTNKEGRLTVFNDNALIQWSGEKNFGGSKLFYTFIQQDGFLNDESEGKGVFFQPRNIVFDLDSDGQKDVIAIKNKNEAGNMFEQIRNYKSGSIEMLIWNAMGLTPVKAPKVIPGQITDIAIGDFDNNLQKELMITIIKKRNSFSSKKSKSMIIVFDI